MKLHLPLGLRRVLMACLTAVSLTVASSSGWASLFFLSAPMVELAQADWPSGDYGSTETVSGNSYTVQSGNHAIKLTGITGSSGPQTITLTGGSESAHLKVVGDKYSVGDNNESYKLSAASAVEIGSVWIDATQGGDSGNQAFRLELAQKDGQQANNVHVNDFYVGSSDETDQYGQLWLNAYTGNGAWNLHLGATSYTEGGFTHLKDAALRVDGSGTATSGYLETLQDTKIVGASDAAFSVGGLRGSFKLSLDGMDVLTLTITGNNETNEDFTGILEFLQPNGSGHVTLGVQANAVQTVGGLSSATSGTTTNNEVTGNGKLILVGSQSSAFKGSYGSSSAYGPTLATSEDYTGTQTFEAAVYAKSLDIKRGKIDVAATADNNSSVVFKTQGGGSISGGEVIVGKSNNSVPSGSRNSDTLHSEGDMTVSDGGKLTVHGAFGLGDGDTNKKNLTVSGAGTTVAIDGRLSSYGNGGFTGNVTVNSGGHLEVGKRGTSSGASTGNNMDAWTSVVTVSGSGSSMEVAGSLGTKGSDITVSESGTLEIGHAICSGDGHNTCTGALTILGGGTVTVGKEGTGMPTHAGNAYVASLTMSDEGSALTVHKNLYAGTGENNFNGAVTINGGTADVKGELHAGAVSVTGGSFSVGNAATVGSLSVSGDATNVTVTGASTVSGNVSVSGGTVDLTGGLTVTNGAVTVNGGEVTVSGTINVTPGTSGNHVTIDKGGTLKLSGDSTVQSAQNWTLGNEGTLDATGANSLTVGGSNKLTITVSASTSEAGGVHHVGNLKLKSELLTNLSKDKFGLTLGGVTDEMLWAEGGWTCDLLAGSQGLGDNLKNYEDFLKEALQGLSDRTEVTVSADGNVTLALHTRNLSWNSGVTSDWKEKDGNEWTWNNGEVPETTSDFRKGDSVTFSDETAHETNHEIHVNGTVEPGSVTVKQGTWTFSPSTTAGDSATVKTGAMSITGEGAHLTLSDALDVEATKGVTVSGGGLLTVSSTGTKKFSVNVDATSTMEVTTDQNWDGATVSGDGTLVLTGMDNAHTWGKVDDKTGFLRQMLGGGSTGIGTLKLGSGAKLSVSDAGDATVFGKVNKELVVDSGATLDVSVGDCFTDTTGGKTLRLAGVGAGDSGAALALSNGAGIGWNVVLDGDTTVSVNDTSSTLSGSLSFGEEAAHTLTKKGAGTLALAGEASGEGTLDITEGGVTLQAQDLDLGGVDVKTAASTTLKVEADASIKSLSGGGEVTVNNGELIIVGEGAPEGAAFTGTLKKGSGFVTVDSGATLKLGNGAEQEAESTLRVLGTLDVNAGTNGSVTLEGTVTGSSAPDGGGALKVTSGNLTLSGAVDVSKIQLESGSKTTISGTAALGSTDTTLTLNGGSLTADGSSATAGAGIVEVNKDTPLGGNLTLTGTVSGSSALNLDDTSAATLSGDIAGYKGKLNTGSSANNSFTLTSTALGTSAITNAVDGSGSINFEGSAVFSGQVDGSVTLNETAEGETLTVTSQTTSESAKLGKGKITLGSIDGAAQWKGTSLGDATEESVITLANVTLGTTGTDYTPTKGGNTKLYVDTAKGAKKTSPGGIVDVNGMAASNLDGITVNLHGKLTNLTGTYAVGENKELELHFSDDNWKQYSESGRSISLTSVADDKTVALVEGKAGSDGMLIQRDTDGKNTHLVFRSTDLIGALDDVGAAGLEVTALANGKWATSDLIKATDGIKKWIEAEYSDHTDLLATIITSIQFTEYGLVIRGATEDLYVVRDPDGDKISDPDYSYDPKEVSHEKRAVVLLDGKTLHLNWDGSERYDALDHIAVHNLLGSAGTTLKITNSAAEDSTGENRLTVSLDNTYYDRVSDTRYEEDGQELDEPYKTDVRGQNTTFGGKITTEEGVDIVKTGMGTLTVLGTYGVAKGTTTLYQGALKLDGQNNELGGLAFTYDQPKGKVEKGGGETEEEERGLTLTEGSSTVITGSIAGSEAYRHDGIITVNEGASLTLRGVNQNDAGNQHWALANSGSLTIDVRGGSSSFGALNLGSGATTIQLNADTYGEETITGTSLSWGEGTQLVLDATGSATSWEKDSITLGTFEGFGDGELPDFDSWDVTLVGGAFSRWMVDSIEKDENTVRIKFKDAKPNVPGGDKNTEAGVDIVWDPLEDGDMPDPGSDYGKLVEAVKELSVEGGGGGELSNTLTAAAGAVIATLGPAMVEDMHRQLKAIRNRAIADNNLLGARGPESRGGEGALRPCNRPAGWHAWINAETSYSKLHPHGSAPGYTLSNWGGTVGAEATLSNWGTAGLALTAMYGDLKPVSSASSYDKGHLNTTYISAFLGAETGPWTHTLALSVGLSDVSLDRRVTHRKGSYRTEGDTHGYSLGALYEFGRIIPLNERRTVALQPVVNAELRHAFVNGYTESGSNAGLHVEDISETALTLGLGARLQAGLGSRAFNCPALLEARVLMKADVLDRSGTTRNGIIGTMRSAELESAEQGAMGLEVGAGLIIPLGGTAGSIFVDASLDWRHRRTSLDASVGYKFQF